MVPEKKSKWLPIKEILIVYLAVSKVLYWVETVSGVGQSDFGEMSRALLMRLLERDLLLIAVVILFYFLDGLTERKLRGGRIWKHVVFYVAGFVGLIGLFYLYIWIISWFFPMELPVIAVVVSEMIGGYLVVIIAINLKYHFKEREKKTSKEQLLAETFEDKLGMLEALLRDGVLSQEEFEQKREQVYHLQTGS